MTIFRRVWPVQICIIIAFLGLYEVASRLNWLDPNTFIPFSSMVIEAARLATDSAFLTSNLIPSLWEIVASLVGGAITGIALGVLFWRSPEAFKGINAYLTLYYAIPAFAIYPVFVSIFGLNPLSIIIIAGLFVVVTMLQQTAIGLQNAEDNYLKLVRTFKLSFWQALLKVFIPATWPGIMSGLRISVSFSIIGVIGTEFILSARGLGHSVSYAYNAFQLRSMYGSIILILAISFILIVLVGFADRKRD